MISHRLHEFLRFCVVGTIGLIIDASLLELLVRLGLPAPFARLISIPCALQCTFLLHGKFTFKAAEKKRGAWAKFMVANLTGAALNYTTFLIIFTNVTIENAVLHRQLAVLGGTMVGLFFNYWANRKFVFGASKP